jgi:hypothetical protein
VTAEAVAAGAFVAGSGGMVRTVSSGGGAAYARSLVVGAEADASTDADPQSPSVAMAVSAIAPALAAAVCLHLRAGVHLG